MSWSDAARLAVGTLTRWPVRPPRLVDAARAGRAMLLAPLVGLGLGGAGAGLALLGESLGLAPLVTAAVVVAGWALASRGLHLDGLADTADGLGSGRPASEALEVMRRGDVGPVGAATLVLVLVGQVGALSQALAGWGPTACVTAAAASRLALPLACRRGVPPARADGLGAAVAGTVPAPAAAAAALVTALAVATVAAVAVGWDTMAAAVAAASVVSTCLAAPALVAIAVRRLGGVSGDVLGWVVELSLLVVLLLLAATAAGAAPATT